MREQGSPGDRDVVLAADLGHVAGREIAADGDLHQAALDLAHDRDEGVHFLRRCLAAGHRLAGIAVVADRNGGAEADGAGLHRLMHQLLHRADFVGRRGTLGRLFAHHIETQRRMAEQRRHVDRRAALFESIEILREGFEWPRHAEARFQRFEAHAFDLLEGLHDHLAMDFPGRRYTEAAVADHRRGDTVPRRDGQHAIPQDLGVVVRVHVDEARRDDLAGRVDRLRRGTLGLAERHDLAVLDAEVADEARLAGAVDDGAAGNPEVERHGHSGVNAYSYWRGRTAGAMPCLHGKGALVGSARFGRISNGQA